MLFRIFLSYEMKAGTESEAAVFLGACLICSPTTRFVVECTSRDCISKVCFFCLFFVGGPSPAAAGRFLCRFFMFFFFRWELGEALGKGRLVGSRGEYALVTRDNGTAAGFFNWKSTFSE